MKWILIFLYASNYNSKKEIHFKSPSRFLNIVCMIKQFPWTIWKSYHTKALVPFSKFKKINLTLFLLRSLKMIHYVIYSSTVLTIEFTNLTNMLALYWPLISPTLWRKGHKFIFTTKFWLYLTNYLKRLLILINSGLFHMDNIGLCRIKVRTV